MPEIHPSKSSANSASENQVQGFSAWVDSRRTPQLLQTEMNSYYPGTNICSNLSLMNHNTGHSHVNPSTFTALESEFNRLNLSTPYRPLPSFDYGAAINNGDGSILENSSLVDVPMGLTGPNPYVQAPFYNGEEIQRMRVQSDLRGQMGSYVQPHNYSISSSDGLDTVSSLSSRTNFDYNLNYNLYDDGFNLNGQTIKNRIPSLLNGMNLPYLNKTSFSLDMANKFHTRGASLTGIEANNSVTLLSSPYIARPSFSSLENLRGKLFWVAKDQYGCRFLQKKFEGGNFEEIQFIFSELKDYVRELMVDQFGNYLIQKLFEICNEEQMYQLLLLVISDDRSLLAICLDMHGTRAMQKMIEHLTTPEQRSLVVSVLRRITVTLTKSINGHHVIQHCLKYFSNEDNKHILNVVADNCLEIATDKNGCCVLQQCVAHANGKPWERLVGEITSNALVLSEHPYGNYVVQYILGLRIPQVTTKILDQLAGAYTSLSMNKYGSNVVEKCLKESEEHRALEVVEEIIRSPNFLMVLQDPYGNYVSQSALAISKVYSKGAVRHAMIHLIHVHYELLHSHPHGKRVLARIRGRKQRV